ncbi:putative alpha beta hydrolase family protein [Neofusicoccum parvum]|uniref:Alpha beta hydrolase family protein n=1 Tax=Neofusicoccum parvum TaxID=310453 RepID=A0ACB5SGJ9_9PEZI|nr:putative alpha beta hydrolase family protein [Neofusicoccum parvum]
MSGIHVTASSHLRLSQPPVYVAAAALSAALLVLFTRSLVSPSSVSSVSSASSASKKVLLSPRTTLLPTLSPEEASQLPYPPDVLPGARDVTTPYGSLRVYEWGPEDGEKVLLVHGISTPSVALAAIAEALARRGKRVMLFDLFGRGYSDAPADLPYDSRLYTTQILLAITSSPLPWTGAHAQFSIVGYSLGGGVAADFFSHFPHLVSSLVLLAPAGLIRRSHLSWKSTLLYDNPLLPDRLALQLIARRLYTPPSPPTAGSTSDAASSAAQAEAGQALRRDRRGSMQSHPAPLLPGRPNVTAAAAVNWQLAHHPGFAQAFASSIRHAPVYAQHPRWRALGDRLSAEAVDAATKKVLLVLGSVDPVVVAEEVRADAEEALGPRNVETVVVEAGHELPMSVPGEVVKAMMGFWGE